MQHPKSLVSSSRNCLESRLMMRWSMTSNGGKKAEMPRRSRHDIYPAGLEMFAWTRIRSWVSVMAALLLSSTFRSKTKFSAKKLSSCKVVLEWAEALLSNLQCYLQISEEFYQFPTVQRKMKQQTGKTEEDPTFPSSIWNRSAKKPMLDAWRQRNWKHSLTTEFWLGSQWEWERWESLGIQPWKNEGWRYTDNWL